MRRTPTVTLTATATVRHNGLPIGRIRADYHGGPYIDLTFTDGLRGHIVPRPIEVLNVWDYETNQARIPFNQSAVKGELLEFIRLNQEQNDEDPHWFIEYILLTAECY